MDPGDWPVADAQSMQPDSKVVRAARNYRLCASEAVRSGARGHERQQRTV